MTRLSKQTLDGNVETLILAVLEAGPSYGYAIVKELNDRAEGILQLGEGTIYPVLYRLGRRFSAEPRTFPIAAESICHC